MEIVEIVSTLISNVGFPIACVVAMFWQMQKERDAHEREAQRWAESFDKNTAVIDHNTLVLSKIADAMKK